MQRMIKIEGTLSGCPRCQRQPKHWFDSRQGGQHFLECSPCQSRTAQFPAFQQAVESWESNQVNYVRHGEPS